jgi:FAD-dependent urate hydroxylase
MSADVVVVGAGPYGLSAAAHLRRAGLDVAVFGDPMASWRRMPVGMLLRSNWPATNIAELVGELSLEAYQEETGARFGPPVPLERFVEYGEWVQRRVVPDLDRRLVSGIRTGTNGLGFQVELEDGERLTARRVVVAGGIVPFAQLPPHLAGLPGELVSHTNEHRDLGRLARRRVAVLGGGQSALESAALLCEGGATVEVFARRRIVWLRGHSVKKRLGRLGPVVYAPTDVGPLWYSRLVALPDLFRQLPRPTQDRIARRSIRPAGAHWLVPRLEGVPIHVGRSVRAAEPVGEELEVRFDDDTVRRFDHLLLGTGYRVDIARYPFLAPELVARVLRVNGYPVLAPGLESSVPGLHFVGAPAAWSFGPIMRFVSGSWYSGKALRCRMAGRPVRRRRSKAPGLAPDAEPAVETSAPPGY